MPKQHLDSDILAVLRSYELAGEMSSKQSIKQIKEYRARTITRLISFVFERKKYYLLYDGSASDNENAVLEHIHQDEPDIKGSLVRNPLETTKAYGMPFRGKDVYLFRENVPKVRLDIELVSRHPDLSRSTLQKYIKSGFVSVNGEVVTQVRSDVLQSDEISMTIPEKESHDELDLPILYLDDNVIVVNKPSGVLTHSKGVMNLEFTVADFFRRYSTFGLETNRPGIVHRLDRDTSGVIIGARNDETAKVLKEQFANRTTKKEYIAILEGHLKAPQAIIDLPIGRHPNAPSTFRIDPSGKSAQTTYEVLETNDTQTLVRLTPKTGRTHQLRVHVQYINTPIVGDKVYGKQKKGQRLYLHAHSLEITIPDGKRMTFTAPLPKEFHNIFQDVTL